MASTRIIKQRIKSATSIAQITKAMEMVAASKMKRAQDQALLSRPYAEKLTEMMADLSGRVSAELHPLLISPPAGRENLPNRCLVVIGPDKGLCGGLITNLGKELVTLGPSLCVTVGKRVKDLALKLGNQLVAEFELGLAQPSFEFILPVARLVIDGFIAGEFSEVLMVYTHFQSTLTQQPAQRRLLPVALLAEQEPVQAVQAEYLFEPSPDDVLEAVLPYYVEVELYQVILEACASEHSARMVAMKNANENANEIVKGLKLVFNEARQRQITSEIADVVTARMALT